MRVGLTTARPCQNLEAAVHLGLDCAPLGRVQLREVLLRLDLGEGGYESRLLELGLFELWAWWLWFGRGGWAGWWGRVVQVRGGLKPIFRVGWWLVKLIDHAVW